MFVCCHTDDKNNDAMKMIYNIRLIHVKYYILRLKITVVINNNPTATATSTSISTNY